MYYFDVANSALDQALDIFAQFFIEPLLSPEHVDKEINAVESEFQMAKNNDKRRLSHLFLSRSNPESVFNTFTMGNLDTLDTPHVYERLREFYRSHYRYLTRADLRRL